MAHQFYWPGITQDVHQFCQNCQGCQVNNTWCQKKHGLLKPLTVPDQIWSHISVDFIEKLPLSDDQHHVMVIVDQLGKGCMLVGLKNLDAETVAQKFIKHYVLHHGFPCNMVSDQGSVWVGGLWKAICRLV